MKVCWLTTVAAPYTINLFNEISRSVDLCVVLNDVKEANRNDDWNIISSDNFKLYRIDKDFVKKIKEFAKEYDIFVDGQYLSIYGYIANREFKKQNKKTVMAADGGNAKDRGFIINGIMSFLMNQHGHFLSSSTITDRYFKFYKVDENKIMHYRFTSLFDKDIIENKNMSSNKEKYRKELGINNFMLLSVGRPIKVKGFNILLDAYMMTGLTDKIDLYIVGGKPQEDIQKIVDDNNLVNVHFVGLLSTKELNKYYAAADTSIICSRGDVWGLVVNESLSFGVPVISSHMTVAGVHFAKESDCVTVCELEDRKAYADVIIKMYEDSDYLKKLNNSSFEAIKTYTIEKSSEDIINNLSLL